MKTDWLDYSLDYLRFTIEADGEALSPELEGKFREILEGDVAAEKALDVSNVYRIRRKALAKLKAWLGIEGSQAASKA